MISLSRTERPKSGLTTRLPLPLVAICLAFPFGVYLAVTQMWPRPYYIFETDLEPDYFYNARLLENGLPLAGIHHPGTPVYLLTRALSAVTAAGANHTQSTLNLGYLVTAVAVALGLAVFMWLGRLRSGAAALAVASVIVWPPFLAYSNYFGADSFCIPIGLVTLSIVWRSLRRSAEGASPVALWMVGGGVGTCLAIKLTFVPVALAILAAVLCQEWRSRHLLRRTGGRFSWRDTPIVAARVAIVPVAALGVFLLWTKPVLNRVPDIWIHLFTRGETRTPVSQLLKNIFVVGRYFIEVAPLASVLFLALTGAFLYCFWRSVRAPGEESPPVERRHAGAEVDPVSSGLLLLLMAGGFVYFNAAAAQWIQEEMEPGILLRNGSYCALAFPFMALYVSESGMFHWIKRGAFWGHVTAAVVVAGASAAYFVNRTKMIATHEARREELQRSITAGMNAGTRMAFWDGGPGDWMGPASFHLWGNFMYGFDQFDQELLRNHPGLTLLKMSEIQRIVSRSNVIPQTEVADDKTGLRAEMRRLLRRWRAMRPQYGERTAELYAGEKNGGRVAEVRFITNNRMQLAPMHPEELPALLQARWGAASRRTERLAGVDWTILSFEKGESARRP